MAIETDIYTPRTLGKLVRRLPPVRTFFLDTFFREKKTFHTKHVEVDFKKGGRALAPFVHPKIGGKTIPNAGYQTVSYTPALVAPNKITTVDDLLERSAGENPYSGKKPADRAVEKLAEDLRELKEMIVRREEWMAATAIFTGKIPIIGEGLNEEIDFEFTNEEKIVTDGLKWSADTADPLADLERWHEQVQKNGFVNCNMILQSSSPASFRTALPISGQSTSWGWIFTSTTNGILTIGRTPPPRRKSPLCRTARWRCCLRKRSIPFTMARSP